MKKHLLLLALLGGTATAAHAQSAIPAGTISLGGSIGYSRHESKGSASAGGSTFSGTTASSQFVFSPAVGYFVADNLAVGANISYTATSKPYTTYTPTPSTIKTELDPTTLVQVGVFGQYYHMITDQFGVVGTLGLGYQSSKESEYSGSSSSSIISELKGSGYYAGLTPSIIYFPIPKIGISASIGSISYDRMSYDYPTNVGSAPSGYEDISSNFGARFGLDQLLFGGTYYFGR